MKAFVTGSTGLLGSNLVRLLAQEGCEVKGLARSASKAKMQLGDTDAQIITGDINDPDTFVSDLSGCDVLFHTAAYFRESFQSTKDHWPMLEETNINNTLNLFEMAVEKGVRRIVHVSSAAALKKRSNQDPSDETDLLNQEEALTPYARSKILLDQEITKRKLPVTTVFPGWMFGPGDAAPTGSGKFVLDYLNRKISGIFDSGIDIVDARDVAKGMLASATNGRTGDRYVLSGHYASLSELCSLLEQVSGIPMPSRNVPKAMIYTVAWVAEIAASLTKKEADLTLDTVRVMTEKKRLNSTKAVRELRVTFRPLSETLQDTVQWFYANKANELPKIQK